MALIAKYVARHRLREPRLLDTIANFLLKRGEQLDSKVSVHPRLREMPGAGSGTATVLGETVSLLCHLAGASHWGLTRMCPDPAQGLTSPSSRGLAWPNSLSSRLQVIQKLVFPFSRMNYRPSNHSELFPKLEAILEQKAGSSPLATVNILMSMFQLSHFPQTVLHQVFSPAFITNVMSMSGLSQGKRSR